MDAQVQLFKTRLSIVSIPRSQYWLFSQGILQLLHNVASHDLHDSDSEYEKVSGDSSDEDDDDDSRSYSSAGVGSSTMSSSRLAQSRNTDNSPTKPRTQAAGYDSDSHSQDSSIEEDDDGLFLHVAFTPDEVTVICSSSFVKSLFDQPLESKDSRAQVLPDSYLALQVGGDGLSIGKRVLELTQPLSEAGISIFFISNYFSDIVLIPENAREKVVSALEVKGFHFSDISGSYMVDRTAVSTPPSPSSMAPVESSAPSSRKPSLQDSITGNDLPEENLESRTFKVFKTAGIKPHVHTHAKLLITGARSGSCSKTITTTATALAKFPVNPPEFGSALTTESFPEYFAITRASSQEVALVLPKSHRTRSKLGFQSKYLVGSSSDVFIPVVIDLSKLPVDSKGIVAGVASKLIHNADLRGEAEMFEMSYLSMAKAGIVMIPRESGKFVSEVLANNL
ncbi:unnamed protein product [Kuraishia capsulata CBS 1993]|uniref:CASTOR ACT domain-containing protein n=1 Tax=Kuraishia capsulata CBS 1993 TaxID=1382522 RepID=W6MGV2_9ASCO|nr:uncharacterized protein KUCA_T00001389001 [Kuraishia capsulata CBS 1993]CDK25419.1 unnamed protein product [Kuraishia capsulata CBS 1993]